MIRNRPDKPNANLADIVKNIEKMSSKYRLYWWYIRSDQNTDDSVSRVTLCNNKFWFQKPEFFAYEICEPKPL